MKLKISIHSTVLLLLLAGGGLARAQSNVPGPDDYARFSRFIAERNIFNPDRFPHSGRTHAPTRPHLGPSSPAFSFVGTMVYDKGLFAFFDGNSDEYRKSLQLSGAIAGYTVQQITLTNVVLAQGSNTLSLAVGSVMQQSRDGNWMVSDQAQDFSTRTPGASSSADTSSPASASDVPSAPAGSSGQISAALKRLMMLRQQENK